MMTPKPAPQRSTARNPVRFAAALLASGAISLTGLGLVIGCGASEDDADTLPVFNGVGNAGTSSQSSGAGGTGLSSNQPSGLGGSPGTGGTPASGTGGTAAACTGANCENPLPMTIPTTCQANTTSCQGNAIATCDANGTSLTTTACAANTMCSTATGLPACTALPASLCTANATFCDTANQIGRCNADGSAATTERCPNGTNCTGAGVCTPVACNESALLTHNGNGGVTVYWFAQGTISQPRQAGQDVNCSYNATRAANDDGGANDRVAYIQDPAMFGAMNFGEYAGAAACGACVQLSQGGRNVTITVADSCNPAINNNGTCTNGHIDLSRNAFQSLTNQSTGDINGITWRYVPCEGVDNIQFLLKEPTNEYWNQFLVVGTRFPIVKAEVKMEDGTWVAARREAFNYWTPTVGGPDGGDMGTYRVRVTDINGSIVEEQLQLQAGLQGGTGQFGCQ
jgi:expansin (peptidoglycan-binding protein)